MKKAIPLGDSESTQRHCENFTFGIILTKKLPNRCSIDRQSSLEIQDKILRGKTSKPNTLPKRTIRQTDDFSFLFNHNPLSTWIYDLETLQFLDANKAAVNHYGYSRAEFLQMRVTNLYETSSRTKPPHLQRARRRRYLKKDGTILDVEVTFHKLTYKGREAVLLTAQDIPEPKSLEDQEGYFQNLFENATIGFYRTTPDGQILMANPMAVKMLGYETFEELAKRNIEKERLEKSSSRKEFKKIIERDGMIRGWEDVWVTKNGNKIYVRESARAVRNDKGKVLYYEGTFEDITELKKTEEKLRLSESELRAIFSAIPDLIMIFDKSGCCLKITSSNPDLAHHLVEDFPGKKLHDIFSWQKADRLLKYIRRTLRTHRPVRFEYALLSGDKIMWFSAITAPLTKDTVVWAARDITAQKHNEEQTQRRLIELQALYESGLAFSRTLDVNAIGEQILHILKKHLHWHHAEVYLRRENSDEMDVIAFGRRSNKLIKPGTKKQGPHGNEKLFRWVMERGEVVRSGDITKDPRYVAKPDSHIKSGLYVPIKAGETAVGMVSAESDLLEAFDENDERLLTTLASQAAVAIQNARLFHQTQSRAMESAVLSEVTSELATLHDIPSLLQTIAKSIAKILSVPGGSIYIYDAASDELEIAATTDPSLTLGMRLHTGEGMAGQIAQSYEPMIIDDYQAWEGRPPQYKNLLFYSVLSVPMLYRGELTGVLSAHGLHSSSSSKEINRKFTDRDVHLLSLFASAAAGAVYSARLLELERKRRQEAEMLQKAASALTSSLNVKQILDSLLGELAQVIPFNSAVVFIKEGNRLHPAAQKGLLHPENVMGYWFPSENQLIKIVSESHRPLIEKDVQADPRFENWGDSQTTRGWMGVPLIVRDEVIGCLTIDSYQPDAFTDNQAEIAMAIGSQAAAAIENAKLFQDALRHTRKWVTLHAVSQDLSRVSENLEQVYTSIHNAVTKLLPAEVFTIALANESQNTLDAVYLYDRGERVPAMQISFGQGFSSRVIESGVSIKIDDDLKSNVEGVQFGSPDMARSILAVPLRVNDKIIGAMSVQSYEPNIYDSEDRLSLELLATQAAIAIENARMFQEAMRDTQRWAALHTVSQELVHIGEDLEQVYSSIHNAATRLLPIEVFTIALLDDQRTSINAVYLYDRGERSPVMKIPLGQGFSGKVIEDGVSIKVDNDLENHPVDVEIVAFGSQDLARSILAVPLRVSGRVIGAMTAQSYQPNMYGSEDQRLLELLANQAAIAIENTRLFEEAHRRAQEFKTLYETTHEISTQHNGDKLLQTIVEHAIELLQSNNGGFYLFDAEHQELELTFSSTTNAPKGTRLKLGEGVAGQVALSREPLIINNYQIWNGRSIQYSNTSFRAVLGVPMLYGGELIGVLVVNEYGNSERKFTQDDANLASLFATQASSVVHNTRLLEHLEERVEQFSALHSIDLVIGSTTDLSVSLQIVIESIIHLLKIDAVDMLLYNPSTLNLEYAVGRGFRPGFVHPSIRLGEMPAGQAALTRQMVDIPELAKARLSASFQQMIQRENFVAYRGLPIIAKGEVKGVLEIYHRSALPSNMEWSDLFHLLAGQAAIAVDNAMLFNNLEHANAELEIAYDTTIESWAQALDQMENESGSHVDRMVERTITLAHKFGIPDYELPNIRRGVLLHNVGMMSIPDKIILKPGPLDEEELKTMRQHPTNAYNLLSKIAYLRPALDIPYCHHEKWDGSGYPRGLKEEQIPLAARVFSVVNVYEALSHERSYRPAWTKDKIIEYIQEQSGKSFDPRVVKAFLEIV